MQFLRDLSSFGEVAGACWNVDTRSKEAAQGSDTTIKVVTI